MVFPRSRAFGAMPAECARWLAGQLNRPPMPGGSGRAGKRRGWDGITLPQETAFSRPSSGASQLFFLHHPAGAGVCLPLADSQGITPARTKRQSTGQGTQFFGQGCVFFFSPMVPINLETQATEHSIMEFACRWVSSYNHRLFAPWEESYDRARERIQKQRHHFANQGLQTQRDGFCSSHVWM